MFTKSMKKAFKNDLCNVIEINANASCNSMADKIIKI